MGLEELDLLEVVAMMIEMSLAVNATTPLRNLLFKRTL